VTDINIRMAGNLHTKFAQVRPLGKSFRFGEDMNSVKNRSPYPYSSQNKSCELFSPNNGKKNNISSHILVREGHYSESERVARKVTVHRRAKSSDSKDGFSGCQAQYKPDKPGWTGSAMQTLDRRISASSDQLDTLKKLKPREKPLRTRSSSRISFERKYSLDESDTEENKPIFTRKSSSKRSIDGPKTPFEMFLEDDGPYSRKLYGPVTPKTPRNRCGAQDASQVRKEKIVYTSYLGQKTRQLEKDNRECSAPLKKGLLWQQKDRFFCRWKERFFILTKDYLQCFKKENSRISEMGTFLFKLKLSDVSDVSLLTKKGYLTISLSHVKDGRVFLRRHEGIKEWYSMIKGNTLESKAHCMQYDLSHNDLNIEAWLLARHSMAGAGLSNPKPVLGPSEESSYNIQENTRRDNKAAPANHPKGINRLSMVAGLIQSENVAAVALKNSDKQAEDSGLESGHTSMNNSSDTQSDGGEDSPDTQTHRLSSPDTNQTHRLSSPDTNQTPDIVRTSLYHRNNVSDSFNLKSSQRRNYYSKLPVTIV